MQHWKVNGEKIECEDPYQQYDFNPSLEYGDFGKCCKQWSMWNWNIFFFHSGEADIKIVDKIGNCRFNMVLKYFFDSFADVDENGEKKVQ